MRGRNQCDEINGCGKVYNQHLAKCPHCGTPDAFSDFIPYDPRDWIYDLETYPNIVTAAFKHVATGIKMFFEISDRINQAADLYAFLYALKKAKSRLVGYNNRGFDYPILHFFIKHYPTYQYAADLYGKAAAIIDTPWDNRFDNVVWDSDTYITQIDLYLIHHFDNKSKRTSLKMLEFNMRSNNIQDLPYKPGIALTLDQLPTLIKYNWHDVDETEKFYFETLPMIEFRERLSNEYPLNFINYNDTKIGKEYFIMRLEQAQPGSCYTKDSENKRQPRQTFRKFINIADVILPYINFKEPAFERVKQWLASQTITETKGLFKKIQIETGVDDICINTTEKLSATVHGFEYVFGKGGIHGSIDPGIVCSDGDYILYDLDVASYYPNLAIVNTIFPEHLSTLFCIIYKETFDKRKAFKKGTPENAMLKLALNGVYGDSNNIYSPFYDPQYTMAITINGQLLLCMLAQYLTDIPGLKMIQANTDGLTVLCPRPHVDAMKKTCKWWEDYTCLQLESVIYSRIFIRDVNNYLAECENGDVKRKGAYEYELDWHQNHSALVVPKAAEAALVHGQDIADFIKNHDDIMDFMLRTKVGRQDSLILERAYIEEKELQRITRYYISTNGGSLFKISPPASGYVVGGWKRANSLTDQFYLAVIAELKQQDQSTRLPHELDTTGIPWDERINTKNRSKYGIRRTGINVGWLNHPCNDIRQASPENINYDYYIAEAEKLVNPLRG